MTATTAPTTPHPLPAGWPAYAAERPAAIAYAIGVRGYQGLGGTVGLSGTFEDPLAFEQREPRGRACSCCSSASASSPSPAPGACGCLAGW